MFSLYWATLCLYFTDNNPCGNGATTAIVCQSLSSSCLLFIYLLIYLYCYAIVCDLFLLPTRRTQSSEWCICIWMYVHHPPWGIFLLFNFLPTNSIENIRDEKKNTNMYFSILIIFCNNWKLKLIKYVDCLNIQCI